VILDFSNIPKLIQEESLELEGKLTLQEIAETL
jgi:hypothetical protein